jgi:aldose sugar dehydrogenase
MRQSAAAALLSALLAVWACGGSPADLSAASAATGDARTFPTKGGGRLEVKTFVSGLEVPWSIVFTSPTRMLVTERPGRVRVVENGVLAPKPLAVLEDVEAKGESGLMGMTLAPDYATSRHVYLAYAYDAPEGTRVRVARYRDDGTSLSGRTVIIEGLPAARNHAGCRIRFGPDGKLYVTTGDATDRRIAQDLKSLGGKTLRLNADGSVPPDNPFPGSPVFSYGHRNAQGIDWDPRSGAQYQTEHGPSGFDGPGGGDEVNLVEKGKNYGWPVVHHKESASGMVSPLLEYTPAVAPAGASFSTGDALPSFKGDFFFTNLRGEVLIRVRFDPKDPRRVLETEELFRDVYGRLRDVVTGPDGALYVVTSNRDGRGRPRPGDDRILRVVEAAPVH